MGLSLSERLKSRLSEAGIAAEPGGPPDLLSTCVGILYLESTGNLLNWSSTGRRCNWARFIAKHRDQNSPDLSFLALHALDALALADPRVERVSVSVPPDLLSVVEGLAWSAPVPAASWTRYWLLALIERAEVHNDRDAAIQVHAVLHWLLQKRGESCYLIPAGAGDAREALIASSYLEPFFAYTITPVSRITRRSEAILAQVRDIASTSEFNVRSLALLHLLAAGGQAVAPVAQAVNDLLENVAGQLRARLEQLETGEAEWGDDDPVTWSLFARSVLARRVDATGDALGPHPVPRRWPGWGFREPGRVLNEREKAAVRHWVLPAAFRPPPRSAPAPVTVVIPCYNLGAYLAEAVESVWRQSRECAAITVIDDGSDDELTLIALDRLRDVGVHVVRQPNGGLAAARNRGVNEAQTEFVCCLDPDDRLRPEYLAKTLALLESDATIAFAGAWAQLFGESELVLSGQDPRIPEMLAFNQTCCNAVFRKSAWVRAGGFKSEFPIPGIEDWDFWLTVIEGGGKGAIVPEILFEYRIRPTSMSEYMYSPERWGDLVSDLVSKHADSYRANLPFVVARLHKRWAEERPWLEDRERALNWWQEQAQHLRHALDQAVKRERGRPAPSAAERLEHLIQSGQSLIDAYPVEAERRAVQQSFRRQPDAAALLRDATAPTRLRARRLGDAVRSGQAQRISVCIATPDIVGPIRNGGIGTAYTLLARALRSAGHEVTILYTGGEVTEGDSIGACRRRYEQEGIEFVPLPPAEVETHGRGDLERAQTTYAWLKRREFDVVHFPEMFGTAACAVEAKRLGLAFQSTVLCVGLHSPTAWHLLENGSALDTFEQLLRDTLERKSVALADVLISPSQYLIDWIDKAGWSTGANTFVHPYATPTKQPIPHAIRIPREIVFFGRLEYRKGLELFCDAIDRLHDDWPSGIQQVTFLGKAGIVGSQDGESYARSRSHQWQVRTAIHCDKSRDDAIAYLTSRPVLAVMPSLADNAPNTISECVSAGVPFVSTHAGGIPELLHPDDRDEVLSIPDPDQLSELIRNRAARPISPRPSLESETVNAIWTQWHEGLRQDRKADEERADSAALPMVSVCIVTRNRPAFLKIAIESIEAQTYPRLELIVVDDESSDPAALLALDAIEARQTARPTRVIRSTRRFPGAARNLAAGHARGEYILFMDDDNIAMPEEISTLVRAARHTGIDLLTCGLQAFQSDRADAKEAPEFNWIPIGPALPLGLFVNCFGDTNMLVARKAFFTVGGFDEEAGSGLFEDWVFHSRALLAGVAAAAVPEPLVRYRLWDGGSGQGAPPHASYVRTLSPYLDQLNSAFGMLPLYASGMFRKFAKQSPPRFNEAHQAARFKRARPLAKVEMGRLRAQNRARLSRATEGISVQAPNGDPRVLLPRIPQTSTPLLVGIDITPPRATTLQLFWICQGDDDHYDEKRSVQVPLRRGRSFIVVELPGYIRSRIRLDPGFTPGTYVLHDIQIRSEAPAIEEQLERKSGLARALKASLRRLLG